MRYIYGNKIIYLIFFNKALSSIGPEGHDLQTKIFQKRYEIIH